MLHRVSASSQRIRLRPAIRGHCEIFQGRGSVQAIDRPASREREPYHESLDDAVCLHESPWARSGNQASQDSAGQPRRSSVSDISRCIDND